MDVDGSDAGGVTGQVRYGRVRGGPCESCDEFVESGDAGGDAEVKQGGEHAGGCGGVTESGVQVGMWNVERATGFFQAAAGPVEPDEGRKFVERVDDRDVGNVEPGPLVFGTEDGDVKGGLVSDDDHLPAVGRSEEAGEGGLDVGECRSVDKVGVDDPVDGVRDRVDR